MLLEMELLSLSIILIAASGIFYIAVNAGLAFGLRSGKRTETGLQPLISVIVAARDEERTLPALLAALSAQTYQNREVIVVDDRSTDRTGRLIGEAAARDARVRGLRITELSEEMPAKKNALRAGIAASRGEILCFTDADCLPGPEWIASLVRTFDDRTGMVAGFSPYASHPHGGKQPPSWLLRVLYRFISYEEFRAGIWAAGSIGWNRAWLCTGRNLAYRRAVYDEVHGFESIRMSVSGDDDLFMQAVRRRTGWKIRYCFEPVNQVLTYPPASFRSFVEQRKRHFSAAKFFTLPMKTFFAAYHVSNTILLALVVCPFILGGSIWWAAAPATAKLIADILLVRAGRSALAPAGPWIEFIPMEILYAFYNAFIGPLGFVSNFRWKPAA